MHRLTLAALLVVLGALSCTHDAVAPDSPAFAISDARHSSGNSHFFFLPPLLPQPHASGVFDDALDPVVEICEWSGACGTVVARFTTTTGTGGSTVQIHGQQYGVNWKTSECQTGACSLDSGATYRLRVLVGGAEVGFADVDVVANGSQLKNVQTDEYIGLVDGRTLPIKFRIEVGMLVSIAVSPSPAVVAAGESLQLTATMRDAHGAIITGLLSWASSNPALATVDANGGVTALEPGEVTITAQADGVIGTASITINKAPATLTIDPATLEQTFDGTPRVVGVVTTPTGLTGVTITYDGSTTPPTNAGTYAVLATLNNAHFEASPVGGTLVVATVGVGVEVSSGGGQACALAIDGTIACWGAILNGVAEPAGTFIQVTAGQLHACRLLTNGSAECWGFNGNSQAGFQSGPFVQISGGGVHSCGVRTNGTGFCWGGAGPAPSGTLSQITAGGHHSCGVLTNGTLACSGSNGSGQAAPPAGTFSQVSGGWTHTCGVRTDATVACWGANDFGQSSAPSGSFTQVSAAFRHTCGVKTDGSVVCWGWNTSGQASPPIGTFRQVSGGNEFTCGVRTDGFVQCWGDNAAGQTNVPAKFSVPLP